jgi:hypothetical protein
VWTRVDVLVEFRCPVEGRLFGKADPGGTGEVQFACRDCVRKRRPSGWRGQVIHVFDMSGAFLRTGVLDAEVRYR